MTLEEIRAHVKPEDLALEVGFAELGADGRSWLPEGTAAAPGGRVVLLGNLDWIDVWDADLYPVMLESMREEETTAFERARSPWSDGPGAVA
jgi:hypothetical protein